MCPSVEAPVLPPPQACPTCCLHCLPELSVLGTCWPQRTLLRPAWHCVVIDWLWDIWAVFVHTAMPCCGSSGWPYLLSAIAQHIAGLSCSP